jgi:uncharacterized protein (DUF58 family)
MGKPFNPADYNLAANPSLLKRNSPWGLYVLLVLCAAILAVLWTFFTPDIRLTRPAIHFSGGQITAATRVTNRTAAPVVLSIRIIVGTKGIDSDFGSGQFHPLAQQDVSVNVPPHSTLPVSCVFSLPGGQVPTHADAELLSRR